MDLGEYSVAHQISDKTLFAWYVPYIMKKGNIIISRLKTKNWRKTHQYGVRLTKNVMEAMYIYQ